ncbi:GerMN domain-containing protein [Calothrix sp. 336/3]|uniref:GerMN domain-containing protein n=1 Tax=Calothrix sp. 336/3 TaxID=1337936 RepID=UPI0004E3FB2F|nr:GerMN domain-containing protein [Calothrix sp. 336/3]AKG20194.1 hypothetical protein IJ00_01715 [Calothrix sp. 336/3]
MHTTKAYIYSLVAIALTLSSCHSTPTTVQPSPTISAAVKPPTETPESLLPNQSSSHSISGKKVNITLYTSDTQCQKHLPQAVAVAANAPVTNAVAQILEKEDTADFSISGYRVKLQNGVATIDFRVAPSSQRQISSLSSCEQFALFGSLRKTLTSNPQWKIKQVKFTQQGEEIIL